MFNDVECCVLVSIDGIMYYGFDINIYCLVNIEGYCGGIILGKVCVGFYVENCKIYDVYISWNVISG